MVKVLALLVLLCVALIYLVFILPFWGIPFNQSRHGRVPLTPPWALECWLWEDDVNTAACVNELLEGYAKYDLPVRTILIDSPWSYRYNDFKVDEERYPEPEKFFRGLQGPGIPRRPLDDLHGGQLQQGHPDQGVARSSTTRRGPKVTWRATATNGDGGRARAASLTTATPKP